MSRDQRVRDNHGLLLATELGMRVHVAFCLLDRCGAASRRHFDFMLDGLEQPHALVPEEGPPVGADLEVTRQARRGAAWLHE